MRRAFFLCFFFTIAAVANAQDRFTGMDAIATEHATLGAWDAVDYLTHKSFDWNACSSGYEKLMDSALTRYRQTRMNSVPMSESERTDAVEFLQHFFFDEKKIEYRELVSLVAQTVVERRIDCDMMCLYLIDFLHTLGVPLSEMGMLTIQDMGYTEGHVILRLGAYFYEPLPVLYLPDSSHHYQHFTRVETFQKYPVGYLFPATDTLATHNGIGILEILCQMGIQYDPCDNGPDYDTGTFRPYPGMDRYLRLCKHVLDVAIPFATRMVEHHPLCFDDLNKLGTLQMIASRVAILSGDTAGARSAINDGIDDFMESLQLAPLCAVTHMNLALAFDGLVLRQPQMALEQAQWALSLTPKDATEERQKVEHWIPKLEREINQSKK